MNKSSIHTMHLVDEFRKAKVYAPHNNYVGVQSVSIHRKNRTCLFDHPPAKIEFPAIKLAERPKLKFACGIKQNVWGKIKQTIVFEIFAKTKFGLRSRLFREEVHVSRLRSNGWLDFEVDLSKYSHKTISLIFSTSVLERTGTAYCWSVWGEPKIEHEISVSSGERSGTSRPGHIILISGDALRADHLGAYGSQDVQTPHCDDLAKDGIVFSHARAQTASTLGSYVTMLLGRHPVDHHVTDEWGRVPLGLPSLPEYLHENGFKTILMPSESELMDSRSGVAQLFDECVPCIGNPAQDGAITTRFALDLLELQQKSVFLWLQYFDTHPPVTPPAPFDTMYYQGDPGAEENRYRPEAVSRIRGVEALHELSVALPFLEQGKVDAFLLAKLEATVLALRGQPGSDPDFAIHLQNLGPRACMNMPQAQFTNWLDAKLSALRGGSVPSELLNWLHTIIPMLREIDDDITSWLHDVKDLRYPLAQYRGAISYFDSNVGKLIAHLKENDLYDQSTIILMSPHGEILDERDIYFHHHTLAESCLRVPVIIKPPQHVEGQRLAAGRIDGVFELMDIFPTIAELVGLKEPAGIHGVSRLAHIRDGSSIPEYDSFAINNSFTMASITRGRYKLLKALKYHLNSATSVWNQGDKALYDLSDIPADNLNRLHEMPELAADMETRLDLFLQSKKGKV